MENGHERIYRMQSKQTIEDVEWARKTLHRVYNKLVDERSIWERHPESAARNGRMSLLNDVLGIFDEEVDL